VLSGLKLHVDPGHGGVADAEKESMLRVGCRRPSRHAEKKRGEGEG